jgi:hypothetical protein
MQAAATNYRCSNVTFRNVGGSGFWYALILAGSFNSVTSNIVIDGGAFDGADSPSGLASIGVGNVTYGGATSTSLNTADVTLKNLKLTNLFNQAIRVAGAVRGFALESSTIAVPRSSALPLVELQGTTDSAILNNRLTALDNDAVAVGTTLGPANVTVQPRMIGNEISGVRNTKAGIRLKNVTAAAVEHNVITPAAASPGAVGIALAASPDGTTNSRVTDNTITAMVSSPIICAVGQGNVVTDNRGAPDCPR